MFYLAVGFKNGNLQIVDSVTLNDILGAPFSYAKEAINLIAFSSDSNYMATAVSSEKSYKVFVLIRKLLFFSTDLGSRLHNIRLYKEFLSKPE